MMDDIVDKVSNSDDLLRDFTAICDTGGRFCGTNSEQLRRRLHSNDINRRQN